jgi:hypothetical protein
MKDLSIEAKHRLFFLALFVLGLLIVLYFIFFLFKTGPEDLVKLKELQLCSQGDVSATSFVDVKQYRKDIYKEIWQIDGLDRKMVKIQSPTSQVIVKEENGHLKMVEELSDFKCWMQEKIFYSQSKPMQELRHLKAQKASFSYEDYSFLAQQVFIFRYQAPGLTLPKYDKGLTLLMKANAKEATFKVKDGGFSFEANKLKATFYSDTDNP